MKMPAKQETQEMQVRALHWKDSLEEEMATHSSIFAWKNPMDRGAWQTTVRGVTKESDRTQLLNNNLLSTQKCYL